MSASQEVLPSMRQSTAVQHKQEHTGEVDRWTEAPRFSSAGAVSSLTVCYMLPGFRGRQLPGRAANNGSYAQRCLHARWHVSICAARHLQVTMLTGATALTDLKLEVSAAPVHQSSSLLHNALYVVLALYYAFTRSQLRLVDSGLSSSLGLMTRLPRST